MRCVKIFIALLITCQICLLCGCGRPAGKSAEDKVIARINNYKMTAGDFRDSARVVSGTKKEVLEQLITRNILIQEAQKENFDKGIRFLKDKGLKVEPLSKSVNQNIDKCVYCGACTAFCPTDALAFDMQTMKVIFDPEKCNGCELCVSACPVRAMEVNLL